MLYLAGLMLSGIACGGPNSPNTHPTMLVFSAQLTSANEVPQVTNADAGAAGAATITLNNLTYDASGNVQSGTVDFAISLNGFPIGTTITAAHIHSGAPGTSGAVIIDTGLSAEGGTTLLTGSGNINRSGISASATTLATLMQSPSLTLFNVHTTISPNGAARGQLIKQ